MTLQNFRHLGPTLLGSIRYYIKHPDYDIFRVSHEHRIDKRTLKACNCYKSYQDYKWFKERFCESLIEIGQILAEI